MLMYFNIPSVNVEINVLNYNSKYQEIVSYQKCNKHILYSQKQL